MPNLTIQDILAVSPEAMPEFIRQHTSKRTLSRVVKSLNRTLIDGDESAREMASAALRHLGFDEKV
jgi:HEAT repeat protein